MKNLSCILKGHSDIAMEGEWIGLYQGQTSNKILNVLEEIENVFICM